MVIINRPTGYMSSRLIKAEPTRPGDINIDMGQVALLPPNLQMQVIRIHDPLLRIDPGTFTNAQTIAFEGSDHVLILSTNRLDHEGKTLPGYSDRITKSTSSTSLAESGSDVEQFEIQPNQKIQIVRFPSYEETSVTNHIYVHVNGEDQNSGNPDFSTPGANEGNLQYRPKHYVPILVPIPDSKKSEAKKKVVRSSWYGAYMPEYGMHYRPEMQYTLVDFKPEEIQPDSATVLPEDIQVIDLTVTTGIPFLKMAQLLDLPLLDGLDLLDATERTYTLQLLDKFGELMDITIDSQGKVSGFDPSTVDADTFTMFSLFQTNDPENILWSQRILCGSCKQSENGE